MNPDEVWTARARGVLEALDRSPYDVDSMLFDPDSLTELHEWDDEALCLGEALNLLLRGDPNDDGEPQRSTAVLAELRPTGWPEPAADSPRTHAQT